MAAPAISGLAERVRLMLPPRLHLTFIAPDRLKTEGFRLVELPANL
jgi:hypothetical protein